MERRAFLTGFLGMSLGLALALRPQGAQAAPRLQAPEAPNADLSDLTLPDGTPLDWAQQRGSDWDRRHHRPPQHRRHHRRHRRQVCRVHRDSFGRRIRRCRWV